MTIGFIKVRCPVCNGGGAVEPWFGQGYALVPGQTIVASESSKKCPACDGNGMQTVTINYDWGTPDPCSDPHPTQRTWYLAN
jgi:DnaJ-class molecular chaperone